MEDPEAYLRALAAPPASTREDSPLPVARFSLEAVANAFVILGLLPAARAQEILAAHRPALQAAGLQPARGIGELDVSRAAREFQQARDTAPQSLRNIPLAAAAGPVRLQYHGLTITSATLTPEGIWVRYHGGAREGDRDTIPAQRQETTEALAELSITDDTGEIYRVPAGISPVMSGRRSLSGGTLWAAEGKFLAAPMSGRAGPSGGGQEARWLEFSAGPGHPARVPAVSSVSAATGTGQPPWPTPGENYLAQFAPPAPHWSIGTQKTGSVELDTTAIVAAVTDALLAVGAVPPDSAVLASLPGSVHSDWRRGLNDRQQALMDPWTAGPATSAGLAIRLPLQRAAAVIENITVREDMLSLRLYGHPWISSEWPMIAPCFRVTVTDGTGLKHEGEFGSSSESPAHEGSGLVWAWPPVDPQAKRLKITVSTLWEAAWALIDIPVR